MNIFVLPGWLLLLVILLQVSDWNVMALRRRAPPQPILRPHGCHTECIVTKIKERCCCAEQLVTGVPQCPVEGPISLGLVIDTSGSMRTDIAAVKTGASSLIAQNAIFQVFYDYVLVPFKDPGVGPAVISTNGATTLAHINGIVASGGGDCPEHSLRGLLLAAQNCRLGSVIFVFTDASSKQEALVPAIQHLISLKRITVIFILTKNPCGKGISYAPYQTIARYNNGQVLLVTKAAVPHILRFMSSSLRAGRRGISSIPKNVTEKKITKKFLACKCPPARIEKVCRKMEEEVIIEIPSKKVEIGGVRKKENQNEKMQNK